MRFKLASGLGEPWTRDGGIPQGCLLSMMFIVALYLPWCRNLAAQEGVQPQLYADNLKCVSRDSAFLLRTSRVVRKDMKDWVLSQEGDRRIRSSTFAAIVRLVISRLVLIFALPLDFHGRVRVVKPAALHGIEASLLASDSLRKLRSSVHRVVWSRRQPLASVGAVLSLLDGPTGCDPAFCVVRFRFRLLRRYLALWPAEVRRFYRLLEMVSEVPGHGPIHLLSASAAEIGLIWDPDILAWVRPGLPPLRNLAGPVQHF